jgi:hypothetical protein
MWRLQMGFFMWLLLWTCGLKWMVTQSELKRCGLTEAVWCEIGLNTLELVEPVGSPRSVLSSLSLQRQPTMESCSLGVCLEQGGVAPPVRLSPQR